MIYFAATYKARNIRWGRKINIKSEKEVMEFINRIEIQGRIGNLRVNEVNGSKVANFSLVTELLYKSREASAVNEITWHNVVAWSSKEMPDLERLAKGMAVNVTGRVREARYTSPEGVERQFHEVLAYKVKILSEEEIR